MQSPKAILVDKIFSDLMDIGGEIDEKDDIIQELREKWAVEGEGMSVVIEVTLSPPTAKNPDPKPFFAGCFTMIDGYPTKISVPPDPHVRIRMDLMCLRFILRGHRYYKGPNGRLKVRYGFRRAYGEERLFKKVRDDVHYLSDAGLVDKVIELLESRIFPRFRKRNQGKWIMKDS